MANQIKAPINYPVIAGGKIVAGGSVLFGQPNVKPDEDNPSTLKAVYLDAALTQPAQNPQGLSSDGVFDQSDTGILFGPEDTVYSIVIKGANKRELSYIPEYDLSDSNAAATAQDAAAAAASSEANALSFKNLTEALYTDFTNRYFGAFSSDPSVDDLGNPPNEGSIYFNSTSNVFFTWTDGAWVNHFPSNPNGLLVTATGTTTPRNLSDRFTDSVSVMDFGAKKDGVTDDTTAFNLAFDYVRNKINQIQLGIIETGAVELKIPAGDYVCLGSINATEIRGLGWTVTGDGANIISKATGKAALDLLGSRWGTFKGLTIYGDESNKPVCGYQIGRTQSATRSCDNHKFMSCKTNGFFSLAAFYNMASETNSHHHPEYWNFDPAATSYVYVCDGNNSFSGLPVSDFVDTSAIPALTSMSNIQHTFVSADMRCEAGGPTMYFSKSNQVKFYNSYAVSADDVICDLDVESNQINDFYFDVHCETVGLTSVFRVKNQAAQAGNEIRIRAFTFIDHAPFANSEIFNINDNVLNLRLVDADIQIPRIGVTPVNGLCNSPSKLKVLGKIYMQSTVLKNVQLYGELRTDIVTSVVNLPVGDYRVIDSLGEEFYKGRIVFASNTTSSPSGGTATTLNVALREGVIEMTPLNVTPSSPTAGTLAVDSGTNWSGVNATGNPRFVQYDGTSWILL